MSVCRSHMFVNMRCRIYFPLHNQGKIAKVGMEAMNKGGAFCMIEQFRRRFLCVTFGFGQGSCRQPE